jgi:hypothetical protein
MHDARLDLGRDEHAEEGQHSQQQQHQHLNVVGKSPNNSMGMVGGGVGGEGEAGWEGAEQSGEMQSGDMGEGGGEGQTDGEGRDAELEVSLWTVQDVMAALWSDLSRKAVSDYKLVGCPPPISPRPFASLTLEQDPDLFVDNGELGLVEEVDMNGDVRGEATGYQDNGVEVYGEMEKGALDVGGNSAEGDGVGQEEEEREKQAEKEEHEREGEQEAERGFLGEEDAAELAFLRDIHAKGQGSKEISFSLSRDDSAQVCLF